MTEPVPGQPCPVCGLPDPAHDWDVHDAQPAMLSGAEGREQRRGAGLPNMLARSSTRGGHPVRVLALHTTEGILRSADLRAWVAWAGSSHAAADADGVLLTPADGFVPYHLAAWTLRSGNPWSDNLEMCGFARWIRADWLARPPLLERVADWLAERSRARGVPLVKITAAQYRAGASGVIAHHDHTVGYSDGTHWDVGTSFPWDVVLPRAQAIARDTEDDGDMNADQDQRLRNIERALGAVGAAQGAGMSVQDTILYRVRDLTAAVGSVNAQQASLPVGGTLLGLVRGLQEQLADLVEQLERPLPGPS